MSLLDEDCGDDRSPCRNSCAESTKPTTSTPTPPSSRTPAT